MAADDFYKGKTIKLLCGCGTGASYDNHSRILSRHLPRHIPGEPNIIVQNMPAAGGLVATNHIFSISPKDGTEIGLFNRNRQRSIDWPVGPLRTSLAIDNHWLLPKPNSWS